MPKEQFSVPLCRPDGRTGVIFFDTFSVGLDELSQKDQRDQIKVLRIIAERGKFSTFEASANNTIAATMTRLMSGPYVKSYTPDSYKAKPEPGGAKGPDRDTYPWTFVRLTEAGKKLLAGQSI